MKNLTNLRFLEDNSIVIRNVMLSYPHLFEPYVKAGDDPKRARYGATFVLDKEEHKEEIAALQAILVERQKEWFKKKIKPDNLCLRDGDMSGKPEYEGKMILAASDKKIAPNLLSRDGRRQVKESDDMLYPGAIVNGRISLWKQDNEHGQKINANLIGVQFMKHNERIGGVSRPKADETFENEGDDDTSDDGFGD